MIMSCGNVSSTFLKPDAYNVSRYPIMTEKLPGQQDEEQYVHHQDLELATVSEPQEPYTTLPRFQQYSAIAIVTAAGWAAPFTAVLYLPLVPRLADQYHVSVQAINLTITVYLIFQAVAPWLLSTHSDTFGRRPIYIGAFTIATLASLGLAFFQSNYTALITLRALQSLGTSSILSVCFGVLSDLRPSSKRGKVFGYVLALGNVGTAIGPIVGGAVASGGRSTRWAFWIMLIFSGAMLTAIVLLLPETARNVVGNGSVQDRWWNQPLYKMLAMRRQEQAGSNANPEQPQPQPQRKLAFSNPLKALAIMRFPDTALTLWQIGASYGSWYTLQVSIPIVFEAAPYSVSEVKIGLCYLPGAAGVVAAMYATGKVMNHNYEWAERRWLPYTTNATADENSSEGVASDRPRNDVHDISIFPIERARSRFCIPLLLVPLLAFPGYGWAIQYHVHIAVPLLLQCIIGFSNIWINNVYCTLIVDVFPEAPSAAATAGSIAKCAFGAAAVAALEPLTKATSRGWFFTMVGLLYGLFGLPAVVLLERRGLKWRQARKKRTEGIDG
jgi:MFS family permease